MFFCLKSQINQTVKREQKKQNVILTFMSFSVFVKEKKKEVFGELQKYIYINISVCFYLMWVWKVWFIFYFQLLVSEEETQQVAPDFKKSRRQFTFSTEVKCSHDCSLFNPFISRCKLIISRHQQEVKCLVISGSSSQIILRG